LIAYGESFGKRQFSNLSGILLKLAIYSGWFHKERLLGSWWAGIELVYTGRIKTSSTWWAEFTGNFPAGQYRALAEWVDTLSYIISGVSLDPVWWDIDFSIDYPDWFVFGDVPWIKEVSGFFTSDKSIIGNKDQSIVSADLARFILVWARWNSNSSVWYGTWIWVYTWWFFVDEIYNNSNLGENLVARTNVKAPTNFVNMQYHPYDFAADWDIWNNSYIHINNNLWLTWVTHDWKLAGGYTYATMPF
jgi:hypothetical protein